MTHPASAEKSFSPRPGVSAVRRCAFTLLNHLWQYPDDMTPLPAILSQESQSAAFSVRDSAFLSELVYGVLRRYALLDTALAGFLKKPGSLSGQIRMLLRLGAYEILFMDRIPERATVNEYVSLARRRFGQGMSGLINGVLRAMSGEASAWKIALLRKEEGLKRGECDAAGMAEAASLPLWLTQMWIEHYGTEQACRLAANALEQPEPCWRVNATRAWGEMLSSYWTERGYAAVGESGFCLHGLEKNRPSAEKERILLNTLEAQGNITRQGSGSQLVAEYIASRILADPALAEKNMWDACCGRGGKTTALLEKGIHVSLASEPASHRLEALKASLLRLGLPWPNLHCGPVQEIEKKFSLILLDVPCSGTGTLARNAELRIRLAPEKLLDAQRVQAEILEYSWTRLLPGGVIFYVTCALNREENECQMKRFCEKAGSRCIIEEEKMFLPLFPGQDALFLAVIRKEI